ncbi:carboxypeptidase-like regulatory domain-containing protein [Myxococcus vastator]|uniref:carboxypeptidase-like regulatory domain-containing protein n=1 Tax=Myxococcus vastator TaxID=2709664 RepID=UPI001F0820D8|nr:carboxypeptidase-like regulatory domain-containing protein [Myxococcus vastator]
MHSVARRVLCVFLLMFALPALAQADADERPNTSTLLGMVRHTHRSLPLADVIVTACSLSLQGALMAVTDAQGSYRIPQLPPGDYTLTFDKEGFKVHTRSDLQLRLDKTLQVDVELLTAPPEEPIRVFGVAPTIDQGCTQSRTVELDLEFIKRITRPRDWACETRSFEHSGPKCPEPRMSLNGPPFSILPSLPLGHSRLFPVPPPAR